MMKWGIPLMNPGGRLSKKKQYTGGQESWETVRGEGGGERRMVQGAGEYDRLRPAARADQMMKWNEVQSVCLFVRWGPMGEDLGVFPSDRTVSGVRDPVEDIAFDTRTMRETGHADSAQ